MPKPVARKAPWQRCSCGRLHRNWNPNAVCKACQRESIAERKASPTFFSDGTSLRDEQRRQQELRAARLRGE